ncbi:MAG: cytochrome c family protein [Leptospirales bacterium]|nr:cytochrome c family protein [Leptospirales bacterium]
MSFDAQRHAARSGDKLLASSAGCRSCHQQVYDNWRQSRHRVAFSNPLYQEAHEREPSVWCLNCHAPFVRPGGEPQRIADRVQAEDGISCITCHVRDGRVLTAHSPQQQAQSPAHDYLIAADFGTEKLCASCHQFNFPTALSSRPGQNVVYSALPMQNVAAEWSEANPGGRLNCVHCHVSPNSPESHRFPGGHALSDLASALQVEAEAMTPDTIKLNVLMLGVGHSFPTGDLFRTLRIELRDARGLPFSELLLKKTYTHSAGPLGPETPARRLVSDTRLPPPQLGAYYAERSFLVAVRPVPDFITVELSMDYLEPSAHILTRLPLSDTRPLIKTLRLPVVNAAAARSEMALRP